MKTLRRIILHIDMDAFYSSVEQREHPDLYGKPVVVGADPKDGKGRGVVMGCSYEARAFGVRSAMPISTAYRLCPAGNYVKPNFTLYEQVSEEVLKMLQEYSDKVEQVSIDEAFLDVSGKVGSFEAAADLARAIKRRIADRVKLTCSVGIAPNKAVAKIASDYRKPDSLTIVAPENVREFLDPLPVAKISGIGKKNSEILSQMGIISIRELAKTHPSKLREVFGKYGIRIWKIANGTDEEEVVNARPTKSISSETTFDQDFQDGRRIMEAFDSIIGDVHTRLQSQKMLFRTVGIKVRLGNFETFTRARTLTKHSNERSVIEDHVKRLFCEFEESPNTFRLVGIRLSGLTYLGPKQETILTWAPLKRREASMAER